MPWEPIPDIPGVWEPSRNILGPREGVKPYPRAWYGSGGGVFPLPLYNIPHGLVFYNESNTILIRTGGRVLCDV